MDWEREKNDYTFFIKLSTDFVFIQVGMCTDGAPVNVKTNDLIKAKLGDHYMLPLCPTHKIELAIRDAFEQSELNNSCNDDYINIYYLLKKANLRWRLFRKQAQFQGINYV